MSEKRRDAWRELRRAARELREGAGASLRKTLRARPAVQPRLLQDVRARLSEPGARVTSAALLAAAAGLFVGLVYWFSLVARTPSADALRSLQLAEATIAYTADGRELTRYHLENRTWVSLDQIAPSVVEALVATEDQRFFRHAGVDPWRTLGALFETAGGDKQGGSTLTMQLARNVFPDLQDDPLLQRKIREWLAAVRIEDHLSKREVLELYLNSVPFMYDAFGIEAAARTYFQKPAAELEVEEAATLVGMLKGTVLYNPVRNPERALRRRNVVLRQMVARGLLAPEEFERLRDRPTKLNFRRLTREDNLAPFFAEHLRQWLDEWADENGYNLYTDGLRVYTTLDARLQRAAEEAVGTVIEDLQAVVDVEWSSQRPAFSTRAPVYRSYREDVTPFAYFWETHPEVLDGLILETERFRRLLRSGVPARRALERLRGDTAFADSLKQAAQRLDAGFVALDPAAGSIKAWVGGRDFGEDEYDHVAQARRQPGSTFKPFVYAAALENGYAPYSRVRDAVLDYVDPYTGERWRPKNFGGASGELVSLSQGLAYSKNTISSRLITSIGPEKVVEVARRMGIRSDLLPVPSLALGTSEVTLLEMAAAYGTFASEGTYAEPHFVTRIENQRGEVIARFVPEEREALPSHVAYAVLDMMRGVTLFGTGVRIRSLFGADGDLAGKTGTTQHGADGWFMLLHPDLVMGAWVGFSSPSISFRTRYWGQGAHNALHIVGHFYGQARDLGSDVLSPEAAFTVPPDHRWGAGLRTESERLTRQSRERNRVDYYLERLRQRRN